MKNKRVGEGGELFLILRKTLEKNVSSLSDTDRVALAKILTETILNKFFIISYASQETFE